MEEVYKEAACFTVDKYQLSKLKDDEAFKEFIIKDLSNKLADRLVDILSREGEIIVNMSDVRCHDNNDFIAVDYRQYLKWSHLVRCKDCIHCDCSIDGMGFFYCDFDEGRTVSPNGFCDVAERRKKKGDRRWRDTLMRKNRRKMGGGQRETISKMQKQMSMRQRK